MIEPYEILVWVEASEGELRQTSEKSSISARLISSRTDLANSRALEHTMYVFSANGILGPPTKRELEPVMIGSEVIYHILEVFLNSEKCL